MQSYLTKSYIVLFDSRHGFGIHFITFAILFINKFAFLIV